MESTASSKRENTNQSTPESEKPKVQLEKIAQPPSTQMPQKQLKTNPDVEHLEMLKQTVAQLAGEPQANSVDKNNGGT